MHEVQTILLKWAMENKEYYMAYILYTEYKIGIPNFVLYQLPCRRMFNSINDFKVSIKNKYSTDEYLNKLFLLFKSSKFRKLREWDGRYGYSLK